VSDRVLQDSWNVAAGASAIGPLQSVDAWLEDCRQDIARNTVPTLIIYSDADRILPPDATSRRQAKMLKHVKFAEIAGGLHGLCWTYADRVNAELVPCVEYVMIGTDLQRMTRRSLLAGAGASVAGMVLAEHSLFAAQSSSTTATTPGDSSASFASLKQIDAGLLNVGYVEVGRPGGVPVVLLHGWPYDIHSFVDAAPLLSSAGFRVIVPHLPGYGTTRLLSGETRRKGQQAAVALDVVALMDALKIEQAILAGVDWGARR
jgi:pimeloyl-ACP methyl ester carboxylesterase